MPNAAFYLEELQHRKERRRRFYLLGIITAILAFFTLGFFFLVFWSSLLKFETVTVSGISHPEREAVVVKILQEALAESRFSWLPPNSFFGWPESVPAEMLRSLPFLKRAEIKKDYRNGQLLFMVSERGPLGIWCVEPAGSCWWFDDGGVLFGEALRAEGSLIPIVKDYSGRSLMVGDTALEEQFWKNFLSVFFVMKRGELSLREITIPELKLQEIEVSTYEGPKLLFSLRFPASNAAQVIQSLKERPDFSKLQYLDFRTENRAYYK